MRIKPYKNHAVCIYAEISSCILWIFFKQCEPKHNLHIFSENKLHNV
jgi:hypothetical protein